MSITELIEELQMLLSEFGDLEVVLPQGCDFDAETGEETESWDAEINEVEIDDSGSNLVVVIY